MDAGRRLETLRKASHCRMSSLVFSSSGWRPRIVSMSGLSVRRVGIRPLLRNMLLSG